jgi:hypothetical protein
MDRERLQTNLSDDAKEIIAETREGIEAEIAAGKYLPATVDQYRILLDHLGSGYPHSK